MAAIAKSAVLVPSGTNIQWDTLDSRAPDTRVPPLEVAGPRSDFANMEAVLARYPTLGFQGSHFGQAVELGRRMITQQRPSAVFRIQDGEFVKVESAEAAAGPSTDESAEDGLAYPNIFFGITATLMGTGCREAVRFLVREGIAPRPDADAVARNLSSNEVSLRQLKERYGGYAARQLGLAVEGGGNDGDAHSAAAAADRAMDPVGPHRSFLAAVVMAGGGPEHDIRRACQPYRIGAYASEEPCSRRRRSHGAAAAAVGEARFGNVFYTTADTAASACPATRLFNAFMRTFARLLLARQAELRRADAARPEAERRSALLDGTAYCSWSTTPSEVWALAGLWMVDVLEHVLREESAAGALRKVARGRGARENKARHVDTAEELDTGDLRAKAVRYAQSTVLYWAARQEVPIFCPSFADGDVARYLYDEGVAGQPERAAFKLDLVRDIHGINKLAMYSKCTGMIICGGGTVKHHICNANLMRNGADYTVLISNGQEFDGSDAGARPEEAVSWGKIRCDGEAVKVYSEVSVVLPLFVAQVFVPALRAQQRHSSDHEQRDDA